MAISGQFDLVDIVLFVNIAETNSLTQGADRSHLSAAAASIRIKHVESRLGAKLLERTTRGVTLTPAGQAFLYHGRQFVNQLQNLQAELSEYSDVSKSYVRLYANTNATSEFLPSVLREYLTNHPYVNVDLREHLSHEVTRAVSEGVADIGIAAATEHAESLEALPYVRDHLVLVVALGHPLASSQTVTFEETLDYEYVGLAEITPIQCFLNQIAFSLRKRLKLRVQLSNFEAISSMVERNVGISIIPESAALRHQETMRIRIIKLSNQWAARDLKIYFRNRRELPIFAQDLIDLLVADGKSHGAIVGQDGRDHALDSPV
jgi:DNA-binding transcriptional LysR family regulator